MVLIVEDGTGKPDADSFVDVAGADAIVAAYIEPQPTPTPTTGWWSLTDPLKEIELRKGAVKLRDDYNEQWRGDIKVQTQALPYPRVNVIDTEGRRIDPDSVPTILQQAQVQLAYRSATTPTRADALTPDQRTPGLIKRTKRQALPTLTENEYEGGASQRPRWSMVDDMLAPLLLAGGRASGRIVLS